MTVDKNTEAISQSTGRDLKRLNQELYALTEIAKIIAASPDLPTLLRAVMDQLYNVIDPAELGVILLWHETEGALRPEAAFGVEFEAIQDISIRSGESVSGRAFDKGEAYLLDSQAAIAEAMANIRQANRSNMVSALGTEAIPLSELAVPLYVGDQKYGVLILASIEGPAGFSQGDLPFVQTLADLIALAIDRARLQEEADLTREAEQAAHLRSEVMATFSHELRSPLAAIKGYSTALLLEEIDWPDKKRHEFLRLIADECDNLEGMVGDLLDSSLIDVGQLVIERQPVRLPHLAKEVADDMQHRTEIHRLVTDFPSGFPILDADPRRILQVIRNILDNAIKYSPDGGLVLIRGEIRPEDVAVSIADQGVGISPEDLIPLFEKYFRVKSATGYHVPGTGLGLPVARSIVEAHGGRIWAESKVGEGTTLYFSLPRQGLSAGINEDE
jgi:signal transduction histidine kinase